MKNCGMDHECNMPIIIISCPQAQAKVALKFKMARIQDGEWQENEELRNDLACLVRKPTKKFDFRFFEN